MNCLDYRRLMETAPGEAGEKAVAHARACTSCAEFARRAAHVDRLVREAVRLPLPENLEERILMRQSFRRPRRKLAGWAALAAGVVLILAGFLFHAGYVAHEETDLHAELVALVEAADYALKARGPVPEESVDEALRPVGLDLLSAVGDVSFAGRCLVRGNLSGHLVLRESALPVTVFLMPDERVARASRFRRNGWQGVVVPAERGSVGIVVPENGGVDPALVERLVRSVRWPAA